MAWDVALQVAIGAVLLAAAVAKLGAPGPLRDFLAAWGVPTPVVSAAAWAVPAGEAACGALLLTGLRPVPAVIAVMLSLAFVAVTVVAARSGLAVGCGCFGALDERRSTPVTVARAAVLAGASLALLAVHLARPEPVAAWAGGQAGPVTVGLLAALVYVLSFAVVGKVYEFERDRPRPPARQLEGTSP